MHCRFVQRPSSLRGMFEAAVDDGAEELGFQQEVLEAGPRLCSATAEIPSKEY